ncbi:rRNA methyltransferase [Comamonas serinivorans]|uniref:rRNA methyltransferase n=1 Tax=Comamonas serinivorans TaxID=1082851 RepID=A0A1Y0EQS6_9BURK|nr:RNA methyltransferase [Comamonas serinivorans]ARU05780.1 rRNA methyltransferase [Comamonas serinivorans]
MPALVITSRDNPRYKTLRKLVQDANSYRSLQRVWVEGDHLCDAALSRGWQPQELILAESNAEGLTRYAAHAQRAVLLPDRLFAELSALPSSRGVGMVFALPAAQGVDPDAPTVVLDRLQDAGNVGSILRSASAFGFRQVLAIKGTAALWAPKVVRAGMGAHFALALHELADEGLVQQLRVPLLATSSHQGDFVHARAWPWPCAWLMGHEGQGVSPALMAQAQAFARIAQPGGEESLNVAAAAAICLHASAVARTGD